MKNRLFFSAEIPFPFETTWTAVDFPAEGWTLKGGGPREIGTTRSMEIPDLGLIVDELLAYDRTEDYATFRYALINEDNLLGARGYEGTIKLYRNAQDPSRCFYTYTSRWDSADPERLPMLEGLIQGMLTQVIEGLRSAQG